MNALKSIKLSLPVDEIRNEEAINSTQNKISFLLYRLSSILQDIYFLYHVQQFVSELIEYKNTKIKGLDLREITSLPESKNGQFQKISIPNHRRLPCFIPPLPSEIPKCVTPHALRIP